MLLDALSKLLKNRKNKLHIKLIIYFYNLSIFFINTYNLIIFLLNNEKLVLSIPARSGSERIKIKIFNF
jgi:hypothetical protein